MRQCCGPGTWEFRPPLPPVLGEDAGDGGAKAAEGNTATEWDRVGRCGNLAVELLVRNETHH